jgi:predicted glycogen debranching enzyme
MHPNSEWLETDGLGGFASGTVCGIRTRRYHALLLAATTPPTGRYVLVNGFDAAVATKNGNYSISSQRYSPDVVSPDGFTRVEEFHYQPWPRWIYRLEDGTRLEYEIVAAQGSPTVTMRWRLLASGPATLSVRLFLSGRDYHALHHENPAFRFDTERLAETNSTLLIWRPYDGLPEICARTNGEYRNAPDWYRNFYYSEEAQRGLDASEDLATPGVLTWELSAGEAFLTLSTDRHAPAHRDIMVSEGRRRRALRDPIDRAAPAYLVRRGTGQTIVAGYPWFTDWGRDTFIAARGLCSPETVAAILLEWCGMVSQGMLPNRFPDTPDAAPEYNSVDASLWFVIAAYETLPRVTVNPGDEHRIVGAAKAILDGYTAGTPYGIHMDSDGLLAAGEPGTQLTWMDARAGDHAVTPRVGKPVEIQALWLNALKLAGRETEFERGCAAFRAKFWDEGRGYLLDVADSDDLSFRPNQIFAIGGLPFALLEGEAARRVVDAVEQRLLTPLGLRTLSPDSAAYAGHYSGGPLERDSHYHQGTVWPWLMGAFVGAWLRVRGETTEAKQEARRRFLDPLLKHLDDYGLGHLPEIADGDPPHAPRGCPFQAWSLGELMRIRRMLAD